MREEDVRISMTFHFRGNRCTHSYLSTYGSGAFVPPPNCYGVRARRIVI